MMRERVNLARDLEQYVGKYYSHQYVRSKILKQNELEQKAIDGQKYRLNNLKPNNLNQSK